MTSAFGGRFRPIAWRCKASVAFLVRDISEDVTPKSEAIEGLTLSAMFSCSCCFPKRGSLEIASYPVETAWTTCTGGIPRLALFMYPVPGLRIN
jgi:hypothetical protein